MTHRRAIPAVLATALAALCAAAPASAQTGGTAPPPPDTGSTSEDGSLRLTARPFVLFGSRVAIRGSADGAAGRRIAFHYRLRTGPWTRIGSVTADGDGSFRLKWKPPRVGSLEVRARVLPGSGTQSASDASATRIVSVHRGAIATWYGPGFYGRRTACGQTLKRETYGVAHRTLPCGTQVSIVYGRGWIVVPVIDRGPYANGADWDLTEAAAQALGMTGTSRIGAMPLAR